ncbi:DedA family protein [Acinetobacter pullicarnis]|mgnify:CR=1 FL=1|uniref:DedA family protein n=1 Tax=Acinetobacter pullicarnis TaxID=2576829 RepID=UPI00112441CD|nr:DedA family protein [Acinetobacter pullicarnis]
MDWASLLQQYGYIAVFIGTIFEGETVLVLGAYAVQQHILNFWLLVLVAAMGGFIGDQSYYQIGAKYGRAFIDNKPKLKQKFEQASIFIDRYPYLTILFMRFAWGLRTILPMSVGIRHFPRLKFIAVNLLACFLWAFVVVSVGIQISHWLHRIWRNLLPYHEAFYVTVAAVATLLVVRLAYMLIQHIRARQKT